MVSGVCRVCLSLSDIPLYERELVNTSTILFDHYQEVLDTPSEGNTSPEQ